MRDFLRGIRVLDLSRYLPGPYATHVLAELGAEVLCIEEPDSGNPMRKLPPLVEGSGLAFQAIHVGKKSVALDLKAPGARGKVLNLAKTCRVFVEGFRPGVAERLGLDYKTLRGVRPDIVYCSITGYGQTGPLKEVPGHDLNFVSLAGMLDVGPLPGITTADFCGGLTAAAAILAALVSGRGAYLDISISDAILSWMQLQAAVEFEKGGLPEGSRSIFREELACYRRYETADGRRLSVAALEPHYWNRLCDALGLSEFAGNPFDTEIQDRAIRAFERVIRTRPLDEWLSVLEGLPVSPVLTLAEALRHPQFIERGRVEEFRTEGGNLRQRIGFPVGGRPSEPRKAPGLGEHTAEVLKPGD